jgi:hypothetical protein
LTNQPKGRQVYTGAGKSRIPEHDDQAEMRGLYILRGAALQPHPVSESRTTIEVAGIIADEARRDMLSTTKWAVS